MLQFMLQCCMCRIANAGSGGVHGQPLAAICVARRAKEKNAHLGVCSRLFAGGVPAGRMKYSNCRWERHRLGLFLSSGCRELAQSSRRSPRSVYDSFGRTLAEEKIASFKINASSFS